MGGDCLNNSVSELDTFNGTSLMIGLFVLPVAVRIFAALTSPSFPLINFSITAIFQVIRGVSSCTSTTSPTLIVWSFLPVAWWNSLREVKYSSFHRRRKCWGLSLHRLRLMRGAEM